MQKFLCLVILGTEKGKKRFGRSRAFRVFSFQVNPKKDKPCIKQTRKSQTNQFPIKKKEIIFLDKNICLHIGNHMRPKLPKVKPTPQKNANSTRSLHPDGIELSATLIR